MDTSIEEDLPFEYRETPEIEEDLPFEYRETPEIAKTKRKDYGNKYMVDRKNLNIRKDNIARLDAIKNKIGCRSYDKTIEHLCDLEEKVDPAFDHTYTCKTCGEEIKDIPKHINVNRFTHRDLCNDKTCKGYIKIKKEMAVDKDGNIVSKKKLAELAQRKKDLEEQKDKQSEERNEEQINIDTNEQGEELILMDDGSRKTLKQIFDDIDSLENTDENVKEILRNQWRTIEPDL